jgi:rubredoxin
MIEIGEDEALQRQISGEKIFHEWVCPTCKKAVVAWVGFTPFNEFSCDYWCKDCRAKKEEFTKCEMKRYLIEERKCD